MKGRKIRMDTMERKWVVDSRVRFDYVNFWGTLKGRRRAASTNTMKWLPASLRNPVIYKLIRMTDSEIIFTGAFEYNTFPIERVIKVDDKQPPSHIEIVGKVEDPNYVSATTNIVRLQYRVIRPCLDTTDALNTVLDRIGSLEPAAKAREEAHEQATMDTFTRRIRLEYAEWMKQYQQKIKSSDLVE